MQGTLIMTDKSAVELDTDPGGAFPKNSWGTYSQTSETEFFRAMSTDGFETYPFSAGKWLT